MWAWWGCEGCSGGMVGDVKGVCVCDVFMLRLHTIKTTRVIM